MKDPILEYKDTIIKLIEAILPDAKIYLFGSRGNGTFTETSDIDIAIDAHRKLTNRELSQLKDILDGLHLIYMIDVVDFHRAPEYLQKTILSEGKVWKN